MKKYNKLSRFPLGSIQPIGYLKDQMLRRKDGMCGHLHELEPEMLYHPYIDKKPVKAWAELFQDGWGAEISGNYWSGYIQFAYTLELVPYGCTNLRITYFPKADLGQRN